MDAPTDRDLRASPTAWDTPGAVWDATDAVWDATAVFPHIAMLIRDLYTLAPLAPLRGGPDYV